MDYSIIHLYQDGKDKTFPILCFTHKTQEELQTLASPSGGSQATSSPGTILSHIVAEGTA